MVLYNGSKNKPTAIGSNFVTNARYCANILNTHLVVTKFLCQFRYFYKRVIITEFAKLLNEN
jgi:hypothetical protein